jgi:hypothetical protein
MSDPSTGHPDPARHHEQRPGDGTDWAGWIAVVLGTVSLVAFIPFLGMLLGLLPGLLAITSGVIGLRIARRTGRGSGRSRAGVVLGSVALTVAAAQFLLFSVGGFS